MSTSDTVTYSQARKSHEIIPEPDANTTSTSIGKITSRCAENPSERETGNGSGTSPSGTSTRGSRFDKRNVVRYFAEDVSLKNADLLIIACCFVSGLCDSSAYNSWACFVSMQTGMFSFLFIAFPHISFISKRLSSCQSHCFTRVLACWMNGDFADGRVEASSFQAGDLKKKKCEIELG